MSKKQEDIIDTQEVNGVFIPVKVEHKPNKKQISHKQTTNYNYNVLVNTQPTPLYPEFYELLYGMNEGLRLLTRVMRLIK